MPSKKKRPSADRPAFESYQGGAKRAKVGERGERVEAIVQGGERAERVEAIVQGGGVETLKQYQVSPTVMDQREKESLNEEEGGGVGDEQDEPYVSREERRQEALKKMQVKAKQFKEKQDQQKRERQIEARPQPSREFQKAKPVKSVGQSSDHNQFYMGDEIRDRTVELLKAAIESCNLPELSSFFDDVQNIVRALEQSIFGLYSSVGGTYNYRGYKKKVRTIIWNLKENNELRTDLLTGVISPKKLASMSTEEMARSEVKKMREEAARQGLVERIGSSPTCDRQPTWQYLTDRQLDKVGDS